MEKTYSYITLYIASMVPWIEQKAGTVALAAGMSIGNVFFVMMLSALTIVPILIFSLNKLMALLKKIKWFEKPMTEFEEKVMKNRDIIEKYEALGLFIVVVVPSTGMWTATFLATLLKVKPIKAIISILAGAACVAFVYLVGFAGILKIIEHIF